MRHSTAWVAVLLQQHDEQWLPVAYPEPQIEKELYACELFHQYVYGQASEVETDHKPLVSIMSKLLNYCPVRIQHMLIRLQKHDMHMIYTQKKYMYTNTEKCAEIQAYVDMIVMFLPADRTEEIRRETNADEAMKEL